MGKRNLLFEGVSGTGEPTLGTPSDWHHVWREGQVKSIATDRGDRFTFFCGGSRNVAAYVHLFDGVFVLDVDVDTLNGRLDARPEDEFGSRPSERDLILRLHRTKEDTPPGSAAVDATTSITEVVDEIIRVAEAVDAHLGRG